MIPVPSIPVRWFAAAGLVVAAVLWHHQAAGDRIDALVEGERDRVMALWNAERAAGTERELGKSIANARETVRRLDRQGESHEMAVQAAARAAADRARAGDAERVLSDHVAVLESIAAGAAASDSAAVADREAARSAARMLADLQRRADAHAGILADYADAARIAGNACAADYDALSR